MGSCRSRIRDASQKRIDRSARFILYLLPFILYAFANFPSSSKPHSQSRYRVKKCNLEIRTIPSPSSINKTLCSSQEQYGHSFIVIIEHICSTLCVYSHHLISCLSVAPLRFIFATPFLLCNFFVTVLFRMTYLLLVSYS